MLIEGGLKSLYSDDYSKDLMACSRGYKRLILYVVHGVDDPDGLLDLLPSMEPNQVLVNHLYLKQQIMEMDHSLKARLPT